MTDFANLDIRIDSSQTKTAASDLDNLTVAGTRAEKSAEQLAVAQARVTNSAGQQRAGFQQLGFQLGDFSTQVSSGTSITQAFAQQIGQTSQALQLMGGGTGALGKVAAFLGTGWGIAFTVALPLLGAFVSKLFEGKGAADDFTQSLYGTQTAADRLADSLRTVQGLRKADAGLALNDLKIKRNSVTERQFQLENELAGRRNGSSASPGLAGISTKGLQDELRNVRIEQFQYNAQIQRGESDLAALVKTTTTATATTGAHTAAVHASRVAHAARTPAISAGQRAIDAATKTTDDYIARLTDEIAKMGKSEQQLRALEIQRAKEGAATEAQRQRIEELNVARENEIAKAKISTAVLADLAARRKDLEGAFDGAVEQASKRLKDEDERKQKAADEYARSLQDMVGLLDNIGGKTGRTLSDIAAIFTGLQTGDFRGVRGPLGAAIGIIASTPVGKKEDGSIEHLGDRIVGIFDKNGAFGKTFKSLIDGAGTGAAIGAVLFPGSKAKQTGAAIGAAVYNAVGTAIGGPAVGAAASIVGSVVGGLVGGLFAKTKSGAASLANGPYGLGVGATVGNSASRIKGASNDISSVGSALEQIAEKLGGTADGNVSVSIGVRNKKFKVDPTGAGRTKGAGVLDFGKDEAAAVRGAIAEALKDGVIQGISAGAQKLLASGDVEKQLAKAVKFQSLFDDLKQRTDPFGFAMEQLSREAEGLKKIFSEAGASAQDYAQLEQLLALKREDAAKDQATASKALKDFLLDLNAGPNSPLSLGQQKVEADAALAPYSAAIASAQAARAQADSLKASGASATAIAAAEQAARIAAGKIDQDGFQTAANRVLGISRASDASGASYFSDFDRIRSLTTTGIGLIDKSATADLTPQIAQNTADTANLMVDNNELLKTISAQLQSMNDNGTGLSWLNDSRSFA